MIVRWRRWCVVVHLVSLVLVALALRVSLLRHVRMLLLRAHMASDHPAVIGERLETFAQAATCVVVASDEEDEEEGEEDCDYGVADGHTCLLFISNTIVV